MFHLTLNMARGLFLECALQIHQYAHMLPVALETLNSCSPRQNKNSKSKQSSSQFLNLGNYMKTPIMLLSFVLVEVVYENHLTSRFWMTAIFVKIVSSFTRFTNFMSKARVQSRVLRDSGQRCVTTRNIKFYYFTAAI